MQEAAAAIQEAAAIQDSAAIQEAAAAAVAGAAAARAGAADLSHATPNFSTLYIGNVACTGKVQPVGFIQLGPNQEIEVCNTLIFAHKSCCQPKLAVGLHNTNHLQATQYTAVGVWPSQSRMLQQTAVACRICHLSRVQLTQSIAAESKGRSQTVWSVSGKQQSSNRHAGEHMPKELNMYLA